MIDGVHISYITVVDGWMHTLMCLNKVSVRAAKSNGITVMILETGNDIFVDVACINHGDDSERTCIGNPAAVDHLLWQLQLFGQFRGQLSTPMHKYLFLFHCSKIL